MQGTVGRNLVDDGQPAMAEGGQDHGLLHPPAQGFEIGPHARLEVGEGRGRQPGDRRTQPHTAVQGVGRHELLQLKGVDDPVDGGSGKSGGLGDLAEAEAHRLILQRAQDRRHARNHLQRSIFRPLRRPSQA